MRVGFNITTTLGRRSGIGHYAAELLAALGQTGAVEVVPYPPPAISRFLGRSAGATQGPGSAPSALKTKVKAAVRDWARGAMQMHSRFALGPGTIDLYHDPNYLPIRARVPTVATVHDLSLWLHPQWHPVDRVKFFEKHFLNCLQYVDAILTDTEYTRQELIQLLNVPPGKITPVSLGIRAHYRPMSDAEAQAATTGLDLPSNFLLYVGTIEPRKNLLMLLQAYVALPAAVRAQCPLVLVGQWGWGQSAVGDYYESTAKAAGVRALGYVPEAQLPAVFNRARALLLPSHYEGFGLPVVEMLACGRPVLTSEAGALVEVAGPCGYQIAANDQEGWTSAMERMIREPDWGPQLALGATAWAQRFTWANCAQGTLAVYRQVLAKK